MSRFTVKFTLEEEDAAYFRTLYRKARAGAQELPPEQILAGAREIVKRVREAKRTPVFVQEAITVLADLVDLMQDEEYAAPKRVRDEVLGALAYFAKQDDLIPDHVPGLGFLDDAIMIKFIEDELEHELWGYRRFRRVRDASEQRPWDTVPSERLRSRLEADRKRIRAEVTEREARDAERRKAKPQLGW